MNLQHVRYLGGFSEHRTLTEAADSLGISQPAISRALHELEQELGCIRSQRTGRRLEFTPAGHDVLKAARRALAAIADIRHVSDAHAVTPILRIATLGAIAAGMSPVLERFIRKEPETQVQVHHFAHEEGMLDMLRRRDVDIEYHSVAKMPWGPTLTATRPLGLVLPPPTGTNPPPHVPHNHLHQLPKIVPSTTAEQRRLPHEPWQRAS